MQCVHVWIACVSTIAPRLFAAFPASLCNWNAATNGEQSGTESAIGLVAGDGAKGTERIVQADRPLPLRVYTAQRRYDSK